jgi:hypothetical protein
MSFASLYAPAKNEMPTGNPNANPAGKVTCGYPDTAGIRVQPPL